MATGNKVPKKPTEKPDFAVGDRVSGTLKTNIYTKEYPSRMARMHEHLKARMEAIPFNPYDRYAEPMYVGDPEYEDGWKLMVERKGNKEFFEVTVAPYKVGNMWHMLITGKEGEEEVDCKDFHLVGERKVIPPPAPPKPLISNKRKKQLMKLSKPAIVTAIVLVFALIIGGWLASNYNDLVHARNDVRNSRSKVDTELTRRYDLIDNIVASVQGSQAQESDVFGKIAEARKIGGSSTNPEEQAAANNTIDTQIALLPRLQEAYPELRSNDQVTRLITELQGTNNTIRDVRNVYNDTVTNYNNNVTSFPKSIFAAIFNFDQEKLFEATKDERVNPKVDLNRE